MTNGANTSERRRLRDHPRGLWVLAGTELWERISYHGMQALLVLYMAEQLLLPGNVERVSGFATYRGIVEGITGPLSVQALAAQTFGLYTAFVFFTPVFGGLIGDRWLGRRVAVASGALLMTAGHFSLAFDRTFLLALLLLILGAGLIRGNLSAQVKALYADGDPREADAFQLYYVGVNLGAFIAPILTGLLGAIYGWHIAFGFAGFGMLLGLVIYLVGQRHLPPDPVRIERAERAALTTDDRRRLAGLAVIWVCSVAFWIAQSQVWNVYNLWVRDHLDLAVGAFKVPVPWLQALDGLSPILVLPIFLAFWRRQAAQGTEPGDVGKLAIGCLIFAFGTMWLAASPWVAGSDGRVPLLWAVAFHLISNIGWLYFVPIAVALYAAKSPPGLRGTMLGVNTLSLFFASIISGRLGGSYETMDQSAFWLMHAAIVGGAGIALTLFVPLSKRLFADDAAAA